MIMKFSLHRIETVTEVTQTRDNVAIGELVKVKQSGKRHSLLLI
jgi:hypothetical protein